MNKEKILSKMHITIEALPEYAHPKEFYDDEQDIKHVCELHKETDWGWCTVKVTAKWNDIEESEYLGACSYESEEDFIKNSGYFEDMKREAIACLFATIQKIESDMY
jgi:hypothetical protein